MTDLNPLGYAVADIRLSSDQCDYIAASLPSVTDQRGGIRGLLSHPTILQLLRHKQLGHYLWSITGRELVAVAAKLLDSAAASAETGQWHQDRVVCVRERMDLQGYGPWTTRVGIPHVEPPSSVLDQMVVVRIHLDSAGDNPGLQVLPGSHEAGKLSEAAIQNLARHETAEALRIDKGAFLLMRPLLVHSTPPASGQPHYRVLYIEFAPDAAISPLQWHSAVPLRRAA